MSMTNEQLLEDLKQFVQTTVSQATAGLATKDDLARVETKVDGLDNRMGTLETKVDDLSLKVDTIADTQAEQLEDHDVRLTRLETKTA